MAAAAPTIARGTPTAPERHRLGLLPRLVATPGGLAGTVLVLAVVVVSLLAPLLAPYPIDELVGRRQELPSPAHWLGTDEVGRDVLSRLIWGARPSLLIGIAASVSAGILGTAVGLVAGSRGGVVDEVAMRVVDVFLAIPALILVLTFVTVLGPSLVSAMVAIAIVSSSRFARVARAPVLSLVRQDFILAARVVGASEMRVV